MEVEAVWHELIFKAHTCGGDELKTDDFNRRNEKNMDLFQMYRCVFYI